MQYRYISIRGPKDQQILNVEINQATYMTTDENASEYGIRDTIETLVKILITRKDRAVILKAN